ncbi:MAG: hypothetical protein KGI68_02675 [Alphaproteobacteria bacterium]|nr:hypothetical protein [Alphaproteobacteria bacterium]MDE1987752.1 hypothetical protein [Alphaproteobacteria bacterium]MDE2164486.1 hypothetical protein [Alphaproteobacteria bacterium]MDE2265675.1 hypothetical protein [Alphaproteobacteria bacterium]MDE2498593.1 hypothetical protein [Alphaproteobacteria bacterium]
MPKFFTIVAALLFLLIAAGHAYRAYAGIEVVVASHVIPMWVSWACAAVTAFLGIMLFVECPRGLHGPGK